MCEWMRSPFSRTREQSEIEAYCQDIKLTLVVIDVLPLPLGPQMRNVGKEEGVLERYRK